MSYYNRENIELAKNQTKDEQLRQLLQNMLDQQHRTMTELKHRSKLCLTILEALDGPIEFNIGTNLLSTTNH